MKNPRTEWFIEVSANRRPHFLLRRALERLSEERGPALDLGCGAGVDSKFLAEAGFDVEAVDSYLASVQRARLCCKGLPVKIIQEDLRQYAINPEHYSIIVAWNSLPFLGKDEARRVLLAIQDGLVLHGVSVVGLFGAEDDWAKQDYEMTFWTPSELESTWTSLHVRELVEEKKVAPTSQGEQKFWHKIQCIAEKTVR